MGLKDDLDRYREVGEAKRQDLSEFIQYGDLGDSHPDEIRIPIKIVDLPEFVYDPRDMGGVGQGRGDTPDVGDPVGDPQPQPGDGDEEGEPGEEGTDHEYYGMDPEEFAEELDDELGLDLDPKGKQVVEETEGDFTDITQSGPASTLDFERLFKQGLKRKLAMDFDEAYVREALRVDGWGPATVFEWARGGNVPVSRAWIEDAYESIPAADRSRWGSIEEMEETVDREATAARIRREGVDEVPFRREDERYRYPEIVEEREKNVVVVNIRDVSGSMRESKRELVERTFTPSIGISPASTTTPSSSTSPTTPTPGRSTARSSSASAPAAAPGSRAPTSWQRSCWRRTTPGASGTDTSSPRATRRTPRTTPRNG